MYLTRYFLFVVFALTNFILGPFFILQHDIALEGVISAGFLLLIVLLVFLLSWRRGCFT